LLAPVVLALIIGTAALAQLTTMGIGGGFGSTGGGGGSPTWTPLTSVCQTAGFVGTVTFSGVTLATGTVVVAVADDNHIDSSTATMTINSNSATNSTGSTGDGVGLFSASNTGSSGNVVLSKSGAAYNVVCIGVGVLNNLSSSTPTSSTSATYGSQNQPYPLGSTLTVNSGGFGIVAMGINGGSRTYTPYSWTGATGDTATEASVATANGVGIGMAHFTTSANPSASCVTACSFQGPAGVAAAAFR
jgi:hypothetical protein